MLRSTAFRLALLVTAASLTFVAGSAAAAASHRPIKNGEYGSGCTKVAGERPGSYDYVCQVSMSVSRDGRHLAFGAQAGRATMCSGGYFVNQLPAVAFKRDGSFHEVIATQQGSHGPTGTLTVSGRFATAQRVGGSYQYANTACTDQRRHFSLRFLRLLPRDQRF